MFCQCSEKIFISSSRHIQPDSTVFNMSFVLCSFFKACSKVCAYVSKQVERVRRSMDGKNVDTVLTELGVRFHRLIHEHLQQFSYSSMGGMLAICDVAEYRRSAKDFRVRRGQRSYFCHLMALCRFYFIMP